MKGITGTVILVTLLGSAAFAGTVTSETKVRVRLSPKAKCLNADSTTGYIPIQMESVTVEVLDEGLSEHTVFDHKTLWTEGRQGLCAKVDQALKSDEPVEALLTTTITSRPIAGKQEKHITESLSLQLATGPYLSSWVQVITGQKAN